VLRGYQRIAGKDKRHVLIFSDADRSLAFLINSRPSPFVQKDPEFARRQVPMPLRDHPFMAWDSYIACHDTVRLPPFPELVAGIEAGEFVRLGTVDRRLFPVIVTAAEGCRLISRRDAAAIRSSFV
jgi:hypothetical protein